MVTPLTAYIPERQGQTGNEIWPETEDWESSELRRPPFSVSFGHFDVLCLFRLLLESG